jgi:hypothetical protein
MLFKTEIKVAAYISVVTGLGKKLICIKDLIVWKVLFFSQKHLKETRIF